MIQRLRGSDLAGNSLWLVISVVLATGVWYIAVTSSDPIATRSFSSIPIQLVRGDSTVLVNNPTRFVRVNIQGSQSAVSSRRADDIVVRADLSQLGAGTHTVPLDLRVSWPESIRIRRSEETQPSQITVELETIESLLIPLRIIVAEPPPLGFHNDDPVTDLREIEISGASSIVAEVVEARGEVDLSAHRSPYEGDVRLYAVNADGDRVPDVELARQTAAVSVSITRRDDVRLISVRPNILLTTLPDGYLFKTYRSDPSTLFIGGAIDDLAAIADTLFTAPISLEDRRADFTASVPLALPGDELFVMGGDNTIDVAIEIVPITSSRQIDNIAVDAIGLDETLVAAIVPQTVSAIVTGPVALVDELRSDDIQVVVDLNGIEPGVYDLAPSVAINQSQLSDADLSLLPAVLNVEIASTLPDPESAAEIESTSIPDDE